ncbi:MAG: hypothetical protein ACKO5C_00985, partial [Ferruginibacter sp.]
FIMKMESLIIQYLLREKQVTLQEIGRFTLHAEIADTDEDQVYIPDGGVSFLYDPKANPDEGLIRFVMEKTKKIRPLAASDLDSFLMLGKQFLHIGKPFTFHRIGMLSKSQQGDILFSQELTEKLDLENKKAPIERENGNNESIDFTSNPNPVRPVAWIIPAAILTLVASLLIGLFWFWQTDSKPNAGSTSDTTSTSVSDTGRSLPKTERYNELFLSKNKDSLQAISLYTQLQSILTQDSIRISRKDSVYLISWTYMASSMDSTRALDSARKTYSVQPVFVP